MKDIKEMLNVGGGDTRLLSNLDYIKIESAINSGQLRGFASFNNIKTAISNNEASVICKLNVGYIREKPSNSPNLVIAIGSTRPPIDTVTANNTIRLSNMGKYDGLYQVKKTSVDANGKLGAIYLQSAQVTTQNDENRAFENKGKIEVLDNVFKLSARAISEANSILRNNFKKSSISAVTLRQAQSEIINKLLIGGYIKYTDLVVVPNTINYSTVTASSGSTGGTLGTQPTGTVTKPKQDPDQHSPTIPEATEGFMNKEVAGVSVKRIMVIGGIALASVGVFFIVRKLLK